MAEGSGQEEFPAGLGEMSIESGFGGISSAERVCTLRIDERRVFCWDYINRHLTVGDVYFGEAIVERTADISPDCRKYCELLPVRSGTG